MNKKTFGQLILVCVMTVFCFWSIHYADLAKESQKYKELFKLYNDIELMKSKKEKYEIELVELERNIAASTAALSKYRAEIESDLSDYAQVLRLRQRNGETSHLKIILDSKDLSDFLYRIGITETINRRYHNLVASLDQKIHAENEISSALNRDRAEVEEKTKAIAQSILEKEKHAKRLEKYLQARGEEREKYERELEVLGKKWSELKPLFAATIKSFVDLIESGGLPDDVIEVRITFGGARGIVREEVFNKLLADAFQRQQGATEITFKARDGGVYVFVPSHEVELFGNFNVTKNTLIYKVERGTFCGIDMGESAIEDLFLGGSLEIDVTHILDIMNMELIDCKVEDGYIDVGIKLTF